MSCGIAHPDGPNRCVVRRASCVVRRASRPGVLRGSLLLKRAPPPPTSIDNPPGGSCTQIPMTDRQREEATMWIVELALRRRYTFIVVALLIFIIGPLSVMRTPTDIFPNIDIPVLSIVWTFNGFSAKDMADRVTSPVERALTTDVDNIEHIESQTLNGVAVIKVFFHPGADINRAIAEAAANSSSLLKNLPPGILPPLILSYNASTVPI